MEQNSSNEGCQLEQAVKLVTGGQLQDVLQVSRTPSYQLIHTRKKPSGKIGRSVRVRLGDVNDHPTRCAR